MASSWENAPRQNKANLKEGTEIWYVMNTLLGLQ